MVDSLNIPFTKNLEASRVVKDRKESRGSVVASSSKNFKWKTAKYVESLYHGGTECGYVGHIAFFLVKVAALELMRRFSKAKCPFAWRSIQALQILCYPPFKWIQRWKLFKGLVAGVQKFSRPLLFLSIATTFSEQLDYHNEDSDASDGSRPYPEPPDDQPTQDTRVSDEAPQSLASESWILQLYNELEKQNIILPERINEDELHRFYAAANGDFPCFLSSIMKTIRWRETYSILVGQDLELWSHLVFWHGCDVKCRPCLVIRLGLACSSLPSHDRPRFVQAIVSEIEHGVLNLVNGEDPRITVLMDCDGLSPLRFPMQMMRTCSALFQDHYPNRLGCLFVLRLPPVVRVIAQTFIQVLRPTTRQKLRIEGETYKKILSEYLETVPVFLGGKCTCPRCSSRPLFGYGALQAEDSDTTDPSDDLTNDEDFSIGGGSHQMEFNDNHECDRLLRTAIVVTLMVLCFVGFLIEMYGAEGYDLSA